VARSAVLIVDLGDITLDGPEGLVASLPLPPASCSSGRPRRDAHRSMMTADRFLDLESWSCSLHGSSTQALLRPRTVSRVSASFNDDTRTGAISADHATHPSIDSAMANAQRKSQ
jgi:hypothetical protein